MKKKLLSFFCLLTLLFIMGCNKEKENPVPTATIAPTEAATPTPTSTPTPTPLPENLALTNLEKLPASFDNFMAEQPANTVDYSNGFGYDITMDLSVNKDLLTELGITGLESIRLNGSLDMKDALALNAGLYLNQTEVITAELFGDLEHVMFNLPKYSSAYASVTMEELTGISTEELTEALNIEGLPTNAELTELVKNAIHDFVACFKPQDGIEANVTIGTGDYAMTGEKHTVIASNKDLEAYLAGIKAALEQYPAFTFENEELTFSDGENFIISYYTNADGSYAWEFYPDNQADEAIVFVSVAKGFCLYSLEAGTPEVILYSVATSDTTGTVTLPSDEAEDTDLTVNYTTGKDSFSISMEEDDVEFSMNYALQNGTIKYDFTLVAEGMSIIMEETATAKQVDFTLTLASYGMKLGSLDMSMTLRDYAAPTVPQNTTDIDSWVNGLDQEALTNDLIQLMTDFPFLTDLLLGSESDDEYDYDYDEEPYVPDADYTDAFMNMTGYAIDEDGYVDFDPLESEVLAAGEPSTAFETLKISDEQKQALFNIAETAIPNCEKESDTSYWVYGSTEYDAVQSYYSIDYEFDDPNNWDNSITLSFDAVSKEFASFEIYHTSKEEAFRVANEVFKTIGGTYTITQEMAEEYTFDSKNGFAISGYDGAEYGSNYYHVEISIYNPDWN